MEDPTKMRKEVRQLSDGNLCDDLERPTGNWNEDVLREAVRRLLRSRRI